MAPQSASSWRALHPGLVVIATADDEAVAGLLGPVDGAIAVDGDIDGQAHLLQHEHGGQSGTLTLQRDQRAAVHSESRHRIGVAHQGFP